MFNSVDVTSTFGFGSGQTKPLDAVLSLGLEVNEVTEVVGASVAAGDSVAGASVAGASVAEASVAGGSVAGACEVGVAFPPPQAVKIRLESINTARNLNILLSFISLSF
jgi:hypothetical protein